MKPTTIWKPAAEGNFGYGRELPISQITYHVIVGDAPGAIAKFQTPGIQVSSTYVIGSDGTIYQMVADANTPYTDNNFYSNSRAITIEHAGAGGVPYTDAMYNASIALTRWLIDTYGINDFKRHRDVADAPTQCPDDLDVERIVNGAKGGDVSTVGEVEIRQIWPKVFGYEASDADVKAWIGSESNTFLRAIVASPQAQAFDQYIADLKKAAAGSAPATYTPVTEQLFRKA